MGPLREEFVSHMVLKWKGNGAALRVVALMPGERKEFVSHTAQR